MNQQARDRRFRRIKELGCIIGRKRGWFLYGPEIHHLNLDQHAGQLRRGDEFTIGLNRWSHRGVPLAGFTAVQCRRLLGPSMALEPSAFREIFGSDDELLAYQDELIKQAERMVVGRVCA